MSDCGRPMTHFPQTTPLRIGPDTARQGRSTPGLALIRLRRDRRGASAVEFAIILPLLLMLVFGIMEFGRALWTQNALHYSVEQAARCATVDTTTCGTASQIASYAAGLAGAGFASSVFTATVAACGNLVAASFPIQFHIPFLNYSLTLTARSCYPK